MGVVVFINLNNASSGGGGGGGGSWGTITGTLSSQTDLQAALDNKANTSHTHSYASLTSVPSTFTPSAHTHAIADTTGLQAALDNKAATSHTHNVSDITGVLPIAKGGTGSSAVATNGQVLIGNGSGYSLSNITAGQGVNITNGVGSIVVATSFAPGYALWGSIGGTLSTQTDLQSALSAKANTTHTHIIADVTGLQTALDAKAGITHSHVIADTTGLQAALDGKAASVHTHQASDVTSGVFPIARGGTNISTTPSNGQILIGNGTGYNLTTVTAGTGITITNGAGSITIASTTSPGSATWGSIIGTLSSQTDLQTALNGKANTTHNHAASEITSGTLAVARGGTNVSTAPTNGQLLIGNGTGYTLANLTAGSNVTITNGVGTITIASTLTGNGWNSFGTTSYSGPNESGLTNNISGGDVNQNYVFGTTGTRTLNASGAGRNITRNAIVGVSGYTLTSGFNGSNLSENLISASNNITLSANNNNHSVANNIIASSLTVTLQAAYSVNGRSIERNSILSSNSVVLGSSSSAEGAQIIANSVISCGQINLTNFVDRHIVNCAFLSNYRMDFRAPSGQSMSGGVYLGGDQSRTTTLNFDKLLNGEVTSFHHVNIMPNFAAQPSLKLWGRMTGTSVPGAHYHANITVDDTALTSNVTFQLPSSNGTNGQFLTTNGSGVTSWSTLSLPTFKTKPADQSVINSTVVVNDDTLSFGIGTSGNWYLELNLLLDIPASTNFRWRLSGPSGATGVGSMKVASSSTEAITSDVFTDNIISVSAASGTNLAHVQIFCRVISGGTAGTVVLQWAQGTANASSLTVRGGRSRMIACKNS